MTVVIHPLSDKKQQKEPLVPADVPDRRAAHDAESGRTRTLVRIVRNRLQPVRERSVLTSSCVFVAAFLLFAAGLAACGYLYQEYQDYQLQQRHFRGWCGIPIRPSEQADNSDSEILDFSQMQALLDKTAESLNLASDLVPKELPPQYFDEEFDLDLEFGEYEKIETPDFTNGRKGRFIHDFARNKTGIVDLEAGRCFVLELNRSRVVPPRNMFDMIEKMRAGYYDIDTEVVHESYRVVTPALPTGDASLGSYINSECSHFPIYRLEKMTSPVFKRSVPADGDEKTKFMEFAGNKVSQIELVNLENAPGRK